MAKHQLSVVVEIPPGTEKDDLVVRIVRNFPELFPDHDGLRGEYQTTEFDRDSPAHKRIMRIDDFCDCPGERETFHRRRW